MANSQHKYLLERGWSQQQIDEVIRKAHEWLRGAGYTPLTEQGHWNGMMGSTQSYHLVSREKDARGMPEAFVEMLKGGKILDASRVHKFSRPGAKARFKVEDRFYFGKGRKERFSAADKVDSLLAGAYRALKNGDKAAAKRMIADAEALVKSDSTVPYYIVNELKDFKKSLRFSRPGKPERFADDAKQIADTILKQLGGGRFIAMTGAKNLAFSSSPPGLRMSIGRGAKDAIKYLRVDYDRGSDTYTMIFANKSGGTVKSVSNVYADSLQRVFTSTTGFDTHL